MLFDVSDSRWSRDSGTGVEKGGLNTDFTVLYIAYILEGQEKSEISFAGLGLF